MVGIVCDVEEITNEIVINESSSNEDDSTPPGKRRRGIGGAPKTSIVWNYFEYNEATDSSKCIVKLSDNRICGAMLKKKYTKTLQDHLIAKHPALNIKETMVEKRTKQEEKRAETIQMRGQGQRSVM